MNAQGKPRIGIVGMGRLGSALAAALPDAGYDVRTGSGRDPAGAQKVADAADIVFITTADGAVPEVCASIRWRAAQGAVHCGGVLTLEALGAARESGALAGCLHPLQSFPNGAADAARFAGITFGVEADTPLDGALEAIAHELGASVVRLEGVDRSLYHAAAILASNDVVALMAAATRAWSLAGLPSEAARPALGPLLLNVAQNVASRELRDALTGPVARGDIGTVQRHVTALAADDELRALYRLLAAELMRLPLGHSAEVSAQLHALLSAPQDAAGS
jgi:predicted short-subunit dehydrogenase-like oxidoreductase (DUF2520 family)